ncbi:hypothetical protein DPMN_104459 [Dreissena polymorpha]|uniref:Uncharacterized protein n=1 Tax=Dreissena polymorpha TaxID=45954 RepID=A0A9D4HFQ6_DREPO|nr:hypothetical protein DPMN_104459 [Dreissena polymorpha]
MGTSAVRFSCTSKDRQPSCRLYPCCFLLLYRPTGCKRNTHLTLGVYCPWKAGQKRNQRSECAYSGQ